MRNFVWILKFNPWHDAKGRFARGGARLSDLIARLQRPDGGFTVHPMSGQLATTGFAVSVTKGRERVVDVTDLTPKMLVDFIKANRDLVEEDGNYMGAWHNPEDGKVYLDVSRIVQDRAVAERLGREHHQLAIFDFNEGQVISLDVNEQA